MYKILVIVTIATINKNVPTKNPLDYICVLLLFFCKFLAHQDFVFFFVVIFWLKINLFRNPFVNPHKYAKNCMQILPFASIWQALKKIKMHVTSQYDFLTNKIDVFCSCIITISTRFFFRPRAKVNSF